MDFFFSYLLFQHKMKILKTISEEEFFSENYLAFFLLQKAAV